MMVMMGMATGRKQQASGGDGSGGTKFRTTATNTPLLIAHVAC